MKKFAMIMALALPLAFASCGDDDETTITLDQSNVSLDYGKNIKLKASEGGVTWGSSNDFVAKVNDKGEVEAEHAGTCTITATKNGSTARCTVTVVPTNNNFDLPILNWGASVADVKNAVKDLNLLIDDPDALTYTKAAQAYPWYIYTFMNGGLAGSMLAVDTTMDENMDLEGFLDQRYEVVDETDTQYIYANANSVAEATLVIKYGYDADIDAVTANWMAPSHTKAGIIDPVIEGNLKAIYKKAASMK